MENATPAKPTVALLLDKDRAFLRTMEYIEHVRQTRGKGVALNEASHLLMDVLMAVRALDAAISSADSLETVRRAAERVRTY